MKKLFVLLQYLSPHHLLSRTVGCLAQSKISFIKNAFIKIFLHFFNINLSEAVISDPFAYDSFNDFFTRQLKPEARPISPDQNHIIVPSDGTLVVSGTIQDDLCFHIKKQHYSLAALLGRQALAEAFQGGCHSVIYLAPSDYHRVHMPCDAQLIEMIYIPGRLFSVNGLTTENVPGLFSRNERVVCIFETAEGKLAVILVGAMLVASIVTSWAGVITPWHKGIHPFSYTRNPIPFKKGDELGYFQMGSTVILLSAQKTLTLSENLSENQPVRMGQALWIDKKRNPPIS